MWKCAFLLDVQKIKLDLNNWLFGATFLRHFWAHCLPFLGRKFCYTVQPFFLHVCFVSQSIFFIIPWLSDCHSMLWFLAFFFPGKRQRQITTQVYWELKFLIIMTFKLKNWSIVRFHKLFKITQKFWNTARLRGRTVRRLCNQTSNILNPSSHTWKLLAEASFIALHPVPQFP